MHCGAPRSLKSILLLEAEATLGAMVFIICKHCTKFPEQQAYTFCIVLAPNTAKKKKKKLACSSLAFFFFLSHKLWFVLSLPVTVLAGNDRPGPAWVPIASHLYGICLPHCVKRLNAFWWFPEFCTTLDRSQSLWACLNPFPGYFHLKIFSGFIFLLLCSYPS